MGYLIIGLDVDRYHVAGGMEWDTLRDARDYARRLREDTEAIAAGMVKVEISRAGECIANYFVPNLTIEEENDS